MDSAVAPADASRNGLAAMSRESHFTDDFLVEVADKFLGQPHHG
jgi:hypothetical protein